jgi:hypothetical protein
MQEYQKQFHKKNTSIVYAPRGMYYAPKSMHPLWDGKLEQLEQIWHQI